LSWIKKSCRIKELVSVLVVNVQGFSNQTTYESAQSLILDQVVLNYESVVKPLVESEGQIQILSHIGLELDKVIYLIFNFCGLIA
jgi:hypothetical protein